MCKYVRSKKLKMSFLYWLYAACEAVFKMGCLKLNTVTNELASSEQSSTRRKRNLFSAKVYLVMKVSSIISFNYCVKRECC